ncbi:MAG TPA: hypothetical protein VGQ17_13965 [Gemmatimonadales bacterium]|jgi:hypothetical protein|nr:hypothetical protein [Gemmatimonadales bacterium]
MRRFAVPVLLFALFAAGCSGGKGVAQSAVTAAEQAVAALPAEAAKVAPEEVTPLTDAVQAANEQLGKGDYEAALVAAKDVPARAQDVAARLPAKKAALTAAIDTLAVAMPRNLEAIKTKLDALGKSKKLPKGMDPQQVQEARDIYAAAGGEWTAIMASYNAGELASAMSKALDLKGRVSRSLAALGLVSDERAWSNVTLPPKS